jgi:hypothetical protein
MPRRRRRPHDLTSFALSFKVVRRTKSAVPEDQQSKKIVGSLPNINISVDRISLHDLLHGAPTARAFFERKDVASHRPRPSAHQRPLARQLRSNSAVPALIGSFPPIRPYTIGKGAPVASGTPCPVVAEHEVTCKAPLIASAPTSKYVGKIDLRTVFQMRCEKVVTGRRSDCCRLPD